MYPHLLAQHSPSESRALTVALIFNIIFTGVPLVVTLIIVLARTLSRRSAGAGTGRRTGVGFPFRWTWAAVAVTWAVTAVMAFTGLPAALILVLSMLEWLVFLIGLGLDLVEARNRTSQPA